MQFQLHPDVEGDVQKVSSQLEVPEPEIRELIAGWLVHLAKFGTSQDQWTDWELWASNPDHSLAGCFKVHAGIRDTPLKAPFARPSDERPLRIVVEREGDDFLVLAVLPKHRVKTIAGRRISEDWAYLEAGRRRRALRVARAGSIGARA